MEEKKNDKTYGIIGTILFHVAILILLMSLFLSSMPQEEEGILVMLGDSPTGMGAGTPAARAVEPASTPPAQSTPPPAPRPQQPREQLMTQNIEEAPVVSAHEKAQREAEQRLREEERRRREEEEQQRRLEEERKRQEELERQQKLAEERRIREERERQAQAARDLGSTAFSGSDGSDQSQGEVEGSGSQGHLSGDPNASSYTGTGLGSSGVSFSLDGRSSVGSLPKPKYEKGEPGVVVVEIIVDRNGNVTAAEPILRGSTIQDSYLWGVAKEAALKARFSVKRDAPAFQKGTIRYQFVQE